MKKIFILALFCIGSSILYAQNASVKGVVTDTLNKQNLSNTAVALLRAKDSVLVKFTRTDKNGNFVLKNLPAGKYKLLMTIHAYADYTENIDLTNGAEKNVGLIMMTLKSRLLEEVFVKQKVAAIRMRGDTIEYKADSFKVREGASVEEMLRKLPGLQVDKDGNITAQGEKIEKVLVDGEEFFGDDPTMATKNLQADAVDRVQVFDKKSDQAVFSGIDDGTKTKTLNLTLKDDKKKGYFGKVELGSSLDNRWNNTVMGNSFKAKRKLSVYGIMSSTGKTGLDWDESSKFGGNNGMQYDSDGGYFYSSGGGDDFDGGGGSYYGQGLPKSWSAGTNYSKKFDQDKQNLNGSYRFNKLNTAGSGNSISKSILPGNVFNTTESRDFFTSKQRNSLNGTYEYQIDSFTSIKVVANGYKGLQESYNTYRSETYNETGALSNTSNRLNSSKGDNSALNSNFILRKRFKKPGRTLSLSFDEQMRTSNTAGSLFSINKYYTSTSSTIDTVDQMKINDIQNVGYYTRASYTEPIVKNVFLELSYGYRVSQSESKKMSYDKDITGKYGLLNTVYSNHYDFDVKTNSGGMMWRYGGKKINFSAGGDVARANFKQTDVLHDTTLAYKYTNFFPRTNFQYKFNANSRFNIGYNGNTRQPTIEQIQPIRENSNPLNVAVGNPNLKQEFRHSFNINFNSYKVLQQRGFNMYGSYSTTSNAISNSEVTDSTGKRTYQYINVSGNYNGNSGGNYNFKINKLDLSMNIGYNLNISSYNSIVNGKKNVTNNNGYGLNFGMYKYKEKKFDLNYYSSVRFNSSTSSIRPDIKTNYITHNHSIYANFTLPLKLELNTNVDANFRQKTADFDRNNNTIVWNAYLGRKLFKNDKGLIKLQANDILDQNRGYTRNITSNILREDNYETLRRYFQLVFVWNFTKTPGGMTTPK